MGGVIIPLNRHSTMSQLLAAYAAVCNSGLCPVCQHSFNGVKPRHALLQHLHRSKCLEHVLWFAAWRRLIFPHGRFSEYNEEYRRALPTRISEAARAAYGEDVASAVAAALSGGVTDKVCVRSFTGGACETGPLPSGG